MNDMSKVIVPDSTQVNADDLLTGPMTIKIIDVKIKGGNEQPVSIFFEGSDKAYRCCKSMARVLVHAWGADATKYVGRSLTLYCDPKVTWAGMAVGGIRISHMSHIESTLTIMLTATRGNKKPFIVKPLTKQPAAAQMPVSASAGAKESQSEHTIDNSTSATSASAADPTNRDDFDPLLIKAQEWAECGLEKYADFWQTLNATQKKHIGVERHEHFKQIAGKVAQ